MEDSQPSRAPSAPPRVGVTFAVVVLVVAAWTAAGSLALMVHPLRHALTILALLAAAIAARPKPCRTLRTLLVLPVAIALAVASCMVNDPVPNLAGVVAVAAALALLNEGADRRALTCATGACAIFTIWTLIRLTVPAAWLLADRLAGLLAAVAGIASGMPFRGGPTLTGLDGLVLALAWYALWVGATRPPRGIRAAIGAFALLAVHLAYLIAVAHAATIMAMLPVFKADTPDPLAISCIRNGVPWAMPVIGALLHAVVIAAMIRWAAWNDMLATRGDNTADDSAAPAPPPAHGHLAPVWAIAVVALFLAALLGAVASFYRTSANLNKKKVVFYEKGFLNWLKPEHDDYGRLSIGMYGLLPHFVRGLGAQCVVSPDLSAKDLTGADVLVLIYPDEPWQDGQLQRIWDFVRAGGSLWILGEHTVREDDGGDRVNDVLAPTAIHVNFDSAIFTIGGWLHSYETLSHPITAELRDDRNQAGIVIGASLNVQAPARPVIVGRWGFADKGDPGGNALMGNHAYNSGERLGDLVLAAEQRFGKGRILVFGDTSSLSNGINMGSHDFTSRVFAYLATKPAAPNALRDVVAAAAALLLVVLIVLRPSPIPPAMACIALAATGLAGQHITARGMQTYPDAAKLKDLKLAYIDAAHLGSNAAESWRDDGLMGLSLNLMRNNYLTLTMSTFSADALSKANLFVTVAPQRAYSPAERDALKSFISGGGQVIVTVGYPDRQPAMPLLNAFGFDFGYDASDPNGAITTPVPMGFFKSPYFNAGDYMVYVRFYAGWPIFCREPDAKVLAYGTGNHPIIIARRFGKGRIVLVGDTCFAMNKNLEVESGQPFEGMRENPHFWRWFISYLEDREFWVPPNPKATADDAPDTNAPPSDALPAEPQPDLTEPPANGATPGGTAEEGSTAPKQDAVPPPDKPAAEGAQ